MDGWMDGWMGGWMDGWVDGWSSDNHNNNINLTDRILESRRDFPTSDMDFTGLTPTIES